MNKWIKRYRKRNKNYWIVKKRRNKTNQDLKELKKKLANVEKDYLIELLEESNVSVEEAIELLGIDDKEHKDDY